MFCISICTKEHKTEIFNTQIEGKEFCKIVGDNDFDILFNDHCVVLHRILETLFIKDP